MTTANGPATGAFQLTMDSARDGNIGLNEAILHVDASCFQDVILSFDQKEFNDEDDPMPATFAGHGNFDGVALSVDGVNWVRVVSLTGAASANAFQSKTFNLSDIAAAAGLILGPDTRIKFQHFDDFRIGTDGFAFDNIRVASAGSHLIGTSPPLAGSTAELFLPADLASPLVADHVFCVRSSDPVLGALDSGNVTASRWVFTGANPPRLVFQGTAANGALYRGTIIFGTYNSGTLDVVRNGRTVRYVLTLDPGSSGGSSGGSGGSLGGAGGSAGARSVPPIVFAPPPGDADLTGGAGGRRRNRGR